MPFYTASNVDLTLNNTGYYVSDVSLSSQASISPVFKVGSILSDEYKPDGGVAGSLSISYYLTGLDPIKELIISDAPVSGNFCGLYFNSGYLKDYSLDFTPNVPARVNASFSFFGQMSGAFSKRSSSLGDVETLNISDFRFNQTGIISSSNVLSLSYKYSNNMTPYYSVQEGQEASPHRVKVLSKSVSIDIETNDYSVDMPSTGLLCGARMSMRDSSGSEKESYDVTGVMVSQSMSVAAGDMLTKTLSITQANLAVQKPEIDSLSSSSGATGSTLTLSGSNFGDLESVNLKGYDLPFTGTQPTSAGTTGINVTIPTGIPRGSVFGGPIEVRTKGGLTISTEAFVVS